MFNRFKRLARRAPAVIALSVIPLAGLTPSAEAVTVVGGVVVGNVTTSGVDLQADGVTTPCPATSYTFASTTLTGAIGIIAPTIPPSIWDAIGTLNVTASGGSTAECGGNATGTVTITGCSGSAVVATEIPPGSVTFGGSISCSGLTGSFTRVGPVVVVTLGGGTVCIGANCGALATVAVAAVFVPDPTGIGPCPGDPTHQCVFRATFGGAFAGAGV